MTLLDLVIVVAGTALALCLLNVVRKAGSPGARINFDPGFHFYLYAVPFLLAESAVVLVSRSIRPRPRWRVIVRQPGVMGCAAYLLAFAINASSNYLALWLQLYNNRTVIFLADVRYVLLGATNGLVVVAVWATLALTGRWRPEPSWIDRMGRGLMIAAILAEVAGRLIR